MHIEYFNTRFELEFSSDNWAMDPSEWMDLYKQKPWIDFMKSGKEESDALKKMNETFGGALDEAQREQKVKEDAEAEAKALDDAKKAATAAIIAVMFAGGIRGLSFIPGSISLIAKIFVIVFVSRLISYILYFIVLFAIFAS